MSEPLAIVGAACRMPGAIDDLDSLWTALLQRRDLVGRVPADRFDVTRHVDPDPSRPGRTYVDAGGFLADIAGFDADYFGISPREASRMDPQQRIMLELTAEALDDAGIDPAGLAGSDTGVYVGLSNMEYWQLQQGEPDSISAYTNLGGVMCVVPNRISYAFDLQGPSLAIDTACSSSLVALHQAAEYLRAGRGRIALAGAVNVLLSPHTFVGFAKASMLSPTGRCHAFSDHPDGYVRSEGGGLVVLKRLSDAVADRDRVHAVLWGSGTNSDGRTAGMSLPSQAAQEALLRRVQRDFVIEPDELVYFEAHGTGTAAGDPVECAAIGAAFGSRRREPIPVGTIKTNVGHLEPAAGMAGLMKSLLVLRHGTIPASLHGTPHNPGIDFAGLGLAPVDEHRPITPTTRSLVGISAYGFGGTNAHAVIGAAPPRQASVSAKGPLPIVVSARTEAALRSAVAAMTERAAVTEDAYDLAWTATQRRGRHTWRAAAFTGDPLTEATSIRAVADGRVVFAFSGNGSQYAGMGADLYAAEPVFAETLDAVDAALRDLLGWSVVKELHTPPPASRLAATEVAQPCLFAVQVALAELLAQRGVRPSAVCGHSVGEIAAAHVAGALSLAQAARLVWARSSAQAITAGTGMMAAVGLGPADAEAALAPFAGWLEIAGVNSDRDVTVAGQFAALDELGVAMIEQGVFFRPLPLDYAFHSHLMDPVEAPLRDRLEGLVPGVTRLPFVSTVTGEQIAGPELDADYWWRNLRRPVRFATAVRTLVQQGFDTFLEIGPHPVLRHYLKGMVDGVVLDTMHRDHPGPARLRATVASLIACGAQVETGQYFPEPGQVVDLPAYPWQRQHHWNGPHCWDGGVRDHPLLGDRTDQATPHWQGTLEPAQAPWLADHVVDGAVLMPGAGFVEMMLAAAQRALDAPVDLSALRIVGPLSLDGPPPRLDVSCAEDGVVRIAARSGEAGEWRLVARCRARRRLADPPEGIDLGSAAPAPGDPYAGFAEFGLAYGAVFRVLTSLRVSDGEVLATYTTDLPLDGYRAHPVIMDGALQAVLRLPGVRAGFLPVGIDEVRCWQSPGATGHTRVRLRSLTERELCADIVITDPDGVITVELTGFRARRLVRAERPITQLVTELRAAPLPEPTHPSPALDVTELTAPGDAATAYAIPALTAHFTVRAIQGLLPGVTEFGPADLVGVRDNHHRLLLALLDLTVEQGLAERAGDGWRLTGIDGLDLDAALRSHPGSVAQLTLVGRAGLHLAGVLRGEVNPVELFFAETCLETLRHLYDLDPVSVAVNRRAHEVMGALTARWPIDRPLRVLEVGGGTGGLTGALLSALPRDRTRYTFTDVSSAFFAKAADRFAAYDFVDYQCLDITRDLAEQGFTPGGYDLVVAANVLHATPDLRKSLRHIAGLLGDGGHLLLLESEDLRTKLLPWGLFDDYWAFTDTGLRGSAILPGAEWRRQLGECGFGDTRIAYTDGDLTLTLATRTNAPARQVALPAATQPWVVLAERSGEAALAAELAALLGGRVIRTPSQCDQAVALLLADRSAEDPVDVTVARITLLQRIVAAGGATDLALITRPTGIHPVPEEPVAPVDAAMWAVLRGLRAEGTDLRLRKISLARGEDDAARLAHELRTMSTEDEVVLTRAGRFVPRLVPPQPATHRPTAGYTVRLTDPGSAYRLDWVHASIPTPGPDQVLVEVRATGLNYRDVLQASGIVTGEMVEGGLAGAALGLEFAGVIVAVGSGVAGFRPGERVFGYASACLSSHVVAPAGLVGHIPDGMSYADAATVPVCYFVAGYLDPIGPGQTVLVHAAAGATGLAAVRHAQARGATVIGTAGTPEKRDFLQLIGVDHVLDSRSLAFADQIRLLTNGRGVDVVLNSLAGEAIPLGLDLLAPGGRFIEIGKRDLYADNSIPLRPFRNNVSFIGVHLDQLVLLFPEETAHRFAELADRVREGMYPALPHRTFPADRISDAFGVLRHSRHIGKIVITFEEAPQVVAEPRPPALDPDGTYLITGGTSGLGAATVDWLAARGAKHIALVGRRAFVAPDHPSATITTYAADVSDETAMRQVIADMAHPLRGVVHAANLLADGLLDNLTPEKIKAGLAAKLGGADVLDRITAEHDLDLFVMYSSINGVYGYFGQVSYAAANIYLDALARRRHAASRPALSVALGGIGDTGLLARDHRIAQLLAHQGISPMSAHEVFAILDYLTAQNFPVSVAARQDWTGGAPHHLRDVPRLRHLLPEQSTSDVDGTGTGDPEEIEETVAALVASILHTAADRLDHDRALSALGVDSLMGTEISDAVRRRFNTDIPTMRIIGGATIAELARTVRTH